MELRVLRYFLAVAREQNISRAAEALHISQPTLSRQLKDLEEEFGKTLFERGNRRITLTEDGMLLRKRAEEIVDLADRTEAEMTSPSDTVSGDIYIGGGETEAMRFVAKVIREVETDYPDIKFHIHSGNATDVTERLDKGLLDFGVLIDYGDVARYEFLRLPITDTWGVLMRKDSPLAGKEKVRAEDLWDLPLICSRQVINTTQMRGWMKKPPEKLNIVTTYNLIYNASLLVEEGVGYALGLDKLIKITDDGPLCFRPFEPRLEVSIDFVWKKYRVFSKAADLFLKRMYEKF